MKAIWFLVMFAHLFHAFTIVVFLVFVVVFVVCYFVFCYVGSLVFSCLSYGPVVFRFDKLWVGSDGFVVVRG